MSEGSQKSLAVVLISLGIGAVVGSAIGLIVGRILANKDAEVISDTVTGLQDNAQKVLKELSQSAERMAAANVAEPSSHR